MEKMRKKTENKQHFEEWAASFRGFIFSSCLMFEVNQKGAATVPPITSDNFSYCYEFIQDALAI